MLFDGDFLTLWSMLYRSIHRISSISGEEASAKAAAASADSGGPTMYFTNLLNNSGLSLITWPMGQHKTCLTHTLYTRWVHHVDNLASVLISWLHMYIECGLLENFFGSIIYANLNTMEWIFSFSFQIWQNHCKGNSILHCVWGWKGFGISRYQPPSSCSCFSYPEAQGWTDRTQKGIHSVHFFSPLVFFFSVCRL